MSHPQRTTTEDVGEEVAVLREREGPPGTERVVTPVRALVAECLDRHEADHPDLAGRLDLRAARFARSCLDRLPLRNTLQVVDLGDRAASSTMTGTLADPGARS